MTKAASCPRCGHAAWPEHECDYYQTTVVMDRYGGTYSGGKWLAFPCEPFQLDDIYGGWEGGDTDSMAFWGWSGPEDRGRLRFVGRGATPSEAVEDMLRREPGRHSDILYA